MRDVSLAPRGMLPLQHMHLPLAVGVDACRISLRSSQQDHGDDVVLFTLISSMRAFSAGQKVGRLMKRREVDHLGAGGVLREDADLEPARCALWATNSLDQRSRSSAQPVVLPALSTDVEEVSSALLHLAASLPASPSRRPF